MSRTIGLGQRCCVCPHGVPVGHAAQLLRGHANSLLMDRAFYVHMFCRPINPRRLACPCCPRWHRDGADGARSGLRFRGIGGSTLGSAITFTGTRRGVPRRSKMWSTFAGHLPRIHDTRMVKQVLNSWSLFDEWRTRESLVGDRVGAGNPLRARGRGVRPCVWGKFRSRRVPHDGKIPCSNRNPPGGTRGLQSNGRSMCGVLEKQEGCRSGLLQVEPRQRISISERCCSQGSICASGQRHQAT